MMIPKAEAYDKFMSGVNAQPMDVVAKTLGMGRNKLFELLRNEKILKSGAEERNVPYQPYFERGYFIVRQVPIARTAGVQNKPQTLVSAKGLDFIRKVIDSKKQLQLTP
jgi:phage antirepressor YoqD-like protein